MWFEGASAAPGDKGVWMRGDAEALADGVCAGSGGGQGDEPAVGRAVFKGLVLRVPAGGFGQHEAVRRVPHIARRQVFADGFPEVLRAVVVPPLFCLVPWGHRKIATLTKLTFPTAPAAAFTVLIAHDVEDGEKVLS